MSIIHLLLCVLNSDIYPILFFLLFIAVFSTIFFFLFALIASIFYGVTSKIVESREQLVGEHNREVAKPIVRAI